MGTKAKKALKNAGIYLNNIVICKSSESNKYSKRKFRSKSNIKKIIKKVRSSDKSTLI